MVGVGKGLNVNSGLFRREKLDRASKSPNPGRSKEAKRGGEQATQTQTTTYPDGRTETTTRKADGTTTKTSTEQLRKRGPFQVDREVFSPKPSYIDCIPDKNRLGLDELSQPSRSGDRTDLSQEHTNRRQDSDRSEELAENLLAAWS